MGKMISGKSLLIPFREVAEALGYKVGWRASESLATIAKGDFYDSYVVNGQTEYIGGIAAKLIDGRTYVAYGYFFVYCNVNITIDANMNVYISSKD